MRKSEVGMRKWEVGMRKSEVGMRKSDPPSSDEAGICRGKIVEVVTFRLASTKLGLNQLLEDQNHVRELFLNFLSHHMPYYYPIDKPLSKPFS